VNLVNLTSMLSNARRENYALGAYNFCNAETLQASIEEGERRRSPVLLIIGPWEISLLGLPTLVDLVQSVAGRASVPVCLHLDHATDLGLVKDCIEAGFPSVMMDASQHEFEENVRLTKAVVEMARPHGVTVEGELGAVGRVDTLGPEGSEVCTLTDPAAAAEFVRRTGVDALAVSIGNAHGLYTKRPELDFGRLDAIRKATDVALVLHGGSGTEPDQLQRAITLGIRKVNVASELAKAYMQVVGDAAALGPGKVWYANALIDAKKAVSEVVGRWMVELGSAGRA